MSEAAHRLAILHYLRGLAALSVAYFHWIPWNLKGYWKGIENVVGKNVFLPIVPNEALSQLQLYELPASNYGGGFGVAVFFLITGFVIPASLERHNPLSFLVGRVFRIYPAHMIGIVVTVAFLFVSGFIAHGSADRFDLWRLIANAFLVQDFLRTTPVNPVFWTLVVEIKFYLLAALVASFGGFTAKNTLIAGLCCIVVILGVPVLRPLLGDQTILSFCVIASFTAINVLYILGGTIFYLIYSRRISFLSATVSILCFMLSFDILERTAITTSRWWWGLPGKWAALCAFAICILAAQRENMKSRALEFLGDVSYPLYLIHMPVGLVLLGGITRYLGNVHIALMVTMIVSLGVAWLIHFHVESPANAYGKRLASQGVFRRAVILAGR